MEKRTHCKARNKQNKYRVFQRKIESEIRVAKGNWPGESCWEAEKL